MKRKFVILYRIAHGPVKYWTTETRNISNALGIFLLTFTSDTYEVLATFDLAPFLQAVRHLPLESFDKLFPGSDSLAIKEALLTEGEKCAS